MTAANRLTILPSNTNVRRRHVQSRVHTTNVSFNSITLTIFLIQIVICDISKEILTHMFN